MTRGIAAPQASRSTVLAEIGTEASSKSAAAAPGRPRRVSSEVVTWICACEPPPEASSTLQLGKDRSAAFRIEGCAQQHGAVFAPADPEPAVLHLLGLLSLKTLAVGGVPVVVTDVIELARRALPSLGQQVSLIEPIAYGGRRPRHRPQMGGFDLTPVDRLDALRHALEILAGRDQVGGDLAGQVAVEADGVDRADIAGDVVVVGISIAGCQTSSSDQHDVDLMEHLLELFAQRSTLIDLHVLRREHKSRLPNIRSLVKYLQR